MSVGCDTPMTLDSVSVKQSAEGDGRTDPSVTLVAFRTDATTVLERLAGRQAKSLVNTVP